MNKKKAAATTTARIHQSAYFILDSHNIIYCSSMLESTHTPEKNFHQMLFTDFLLIKCHQRSIVRIFYKEDTYCKISFDLFKLALVSSRCIIPFGLQKWATMSIHGAKQWTMFKMRKLKWNLNLSALLGEKKKRKNDDRIQAK